MTNSPYADAKEDVLIEIIRQAEARLDAQLTAAIGADQRAMTFAGLLFAGSAAIAAVAPAFDQTLPAVFMLLIGAGFLTSGSLAALSARPTQWEYVGNVPSSWLSDISTERALHESKADMAGFYDEMIGINETAIAKAGKLVRYSMTGALISGIGAILFVVSRGFW